MPTDFKKKHKLLGSSANPEKYALTVLAGVPFLVSLAAMFGLDLDGASIIEAINQVVVGVSGIVTLFGVGRKVYYKFFS